ncbi:MAG: hypothetical protein JJ896_12655 [Rhodothermales bacterium]|nr:hypothetical protein [Rhodothermales bacterium]MBO6780497.1 hypothetical protein [Rhodothermales bacterium]
MSTVTLVAHNVAYLRQALLLLEDLDDAAFIETRPPFFRSGVGEHLRHILEHYQCFVQGLPSGAIDYDGRRRDERISGSTEYARSVVLALVEAMEALSGHDCEVRVRLDGSSHGSDSDPWSRSTARRELQYLQAHTVHHYALIAFILRLQGREPSPDFGVAPSTLRHRSMATKD